MDVHVQKIRFKEIEKLGVAYMDYEIASGKYKIGTAPEGDGMSPPNVTHYEPDDDLPNDSSV